jgi:hypothetical protein
MGVSSFRDGPKDQTSVAQLRIGESSRFSGAQLRAIVRFALRNDDYVVTFSSRRSFVSSIGSTLSGVARGKARLERYWNYFGCSFKAAELMQ